MAMFGKRYLYSIKCDNTRCEEEGSRFGNVAICQFGNEVDVTIDLEMWQFGDLIMYQCSNISLGWCEQPVLNLFQYLARTETGRYFLSGAGPPSPDKGRSLNPALNQTLNFEPGTLNLIFSMSCQVGLFI